MRREVRIRCSAPAHDSEDQHCPTWRFGCKSSLMAVESKPLFHPEVMRQQVRAFTLPAHVAACQPRLQHWASLIASGRADEFKETALLPDFLTDIFCGLLGYTGPAAARDVAADVSRRHLPGEQAAPTDVGGYYTLSRERHVEVDGKFADAVLGRFHAKPSAGRDASPRRPFVPAGGRRGARARS